MISSPTQNQEMKEKVQKVSNLSLSKNIKSAKSTNTQKMKNNQARNKETQDKDIFYEVSW